jgi:hypothetical protein
VVKSASVAKPKKSAFAFQAPTANYVSANEKATWDVAAWNKTTACTSKTNTDARIFAMERDLLELS